MSLLRREVFTPSTGTSSYQPIKKHAKNYIAHIPTDLLVTSDIVTFWYRLIEKYYHISLLIVHCTLTCKDKLHGYNPAIAHLYPIAIPCIISWPVGQREGCTMQM